MERIDVIVETRCRQSFRSHSLESITQQLPSFHANASIGPIPGRAATKEVQRSLEAAKDQLVLVFGSVEVACLEKLRRHPDVVEVWLDNHLHPFSSHAAKSQRDDWLVDVVSSSPVDCPIPPCDFDPSRPCGSLSDVAAVLGADEIWIDGISGEGVVIGIVDGGLWAEGRMDAARSGLVPRVIDGWPAENWGTIAGWGRHGNMVAVDALGMAPRACLYDIRISDPSPGGGRVSGAMAGIEWAIEKYRAVGAPQILCCGWGVYQEQHDPKYATDANHPLTRKIVEAMDEGIIVLFAAGNGGQSCPAAACGEVVGPGRSIWGPNGHPRVMTVGAVNNDEQLIGYSSQGPAALNENKPDFCGISHFAGYFSSDSGTSAACAIAAGTVALLKQARPTLTQEAAKDLLKTTAKDIGPPGWDRHSGAGILQAKAAYQRLLGGRSMKWKDSARLDQLELENHYLKELFVELALERRMFQGQHLSSRDSDSRTNTAAPTTGRG